MERCAGRIAWRSSNVDSEDLDAVEWFVVAHGSEIIRERTSTPSRLSIPVGGGRRARGERRSSVEFSGHLQQFEEPLRRVPLIPEPADLAAVVEEQDPPVPAVFIAREGLDIPRIDTLMFASPMSDILQAVGRILRVHPEKCTPLVIDIVDNFSLFKGMHWKRNRYYRSEGYEVRRLSI